MFTLRRLVVVAACALLAQGCASTSYVTPWLRAKSSSGVCVMAESGSDQCRTKVTHEVLSDDGWKPAPYSGFHTPFCSQTRVAHDHAIISKQGRVADYECKGHRLATPDQLGILCSAVPSDSQSLTLHLTSCDGAIAWRETLVTPLPVPKDARPFEYDLSLNTIGFLHGEPVVVASLQKLRSEATERSSSAFVLERATHSWKLLGSSAERGSTYAGAAKWSKTLGLPIANAGSD